MAFCGSCGAELPSDAQFCGECGQRAIPEGSSDSSMPHRESDEPATTDSKPGALPRIVAIIVALIAVGLIRQWVQGSDIGPQIREWYQKTIVGSSEP